MKSFATSICPIKNPLAVNMRHWVAAPSNPRAIPAPSPRGEAVIYRPFGTATLPRGVSEASPRGKGVIYRLFGTATPPRGISEPSSRGKAFFYPAFGTTNLSTGTPEASSCGGLKPVIYLCSSMKLAFFMDIEVLTGCLSMKLAFFMDIEVWIGSLAIKPAFIIADEVRQGGRTVLQARRPTHNYPRGDPDRGGNAHFADNPCLFTGKMVYLRPHNFRAG